MQLTEFLRSLSSDERDFIAGLDCGDQRDRHRRELDRVIDEGGRVDMKTQLWCPYEVIELGKNWLQDGHEREFVACAGIVLFNIAAGEDRMNSAEIGFGVVLENFSNLQMEHQEFLRPMLEKITN